MGGSKSGVNSHEEPEHKEPENEEGSKEEAGITVEEKRDSRREQKENQEKGTTHKTI